MSNRENRYLKILSVPAASCLIIIMITLYFANSAVTKEDRKKIEEKIASDPHTLIVYVRNLPTSVGYVDFTVFSSKEEYVRGFVPFAHDRVKIWNREAKLLVPHAPYGFYAVRAYHDIDRNGKLTRALTGDPTEAYGYSRGARPRFGRPKWEEICEMFDENHRTIEVELK